MLKLAANNEILIDNRATGLGLAQTGGGSIVYTIERSGVPYKAHQMPYRRYSAAHAQPKRKDQAEYDPAICAGSEQLEADVRAILAKMPA